MKVLRWMVVAVLLGCVGCLKVDQVIEIGADGSGSMNMSYGMSEQTIAQMESMKTMMSGMVDEDGKPIEADDEDDDMFDFDEAKIRKRFDDLKDSGITLKSAKSESRDGWRYMNIAFDFKDLKKVAEADYLGDGSFSLSKDAEGNYVMVQKSSQKGMGGDEDIDPAMMSQMAPMFKGMRMALTVKTPSAILDTNGEKKDDRTVAWVFDVDKDPSLLSNMSKTEMRVVFKGDGVDLPTIVPSQDD